MNLRNIAILAVALLAGAIGFWYWSGGRETSPADSETSDTASGPGISQAPATPTPSTAVVPGSVPPTPAPVAPSAGEQPAAPARIASSVLPGMPLVRTATRPPPAVPPVAAPTRPSRPPEPEREGRVELEAVQFMLRDFRTRIGENPVGTNAEIMKAVMGGNSAKARLGPPEGQGLNEQGELIDKWGTPYFFHQMSKDNMEIRSAGPDQKMWTNDDVIAQ